MSGKSRKRGAGTGGKQKKPPRDIAPAQSKKARTGSLPAGELSKSGKSTASSKNRPEASYLLQCDVPTKQYIQYLNDIKGTEHKKFIVQDLDSTHLLIKLSARAEIEQKVEDWLDVNVYSAVEKVGEDFDVS